MEGGKCGNLDILLVWVDSGDDFKNLDYIVMIVWFCFRCKKLVVFWNSF